MFAAVFPGQGSQSIGMMSELYSASSIVRDTFNEASSVLSYDLWALITDGPEAQLNDTLYTQPAMLVAGVAAWRFFISKTTLSPTIMAGHSLGEYTALVCSGALDFQGTIELVKYRAQLMHQAVPKNSGAMAAILGLDNLGVINACKAAEEGEIVEAVNFNAPGQVVIAGEKSAVERAINLCKENGARRAMLLNVSIPSHCRLMHPAAKKLQKKLEEVNYNKVIIPVLNNVDVKLYSDKTSIIQGLTRQLYNPVRWAETMQDIASKDIAISVEFGPGGVLSGLAKRIDKNNQTIKFNTIDSFDKFNELVKKN